MKKYLPALTGIIVFLVSVTSLTAQTSSRQFGSAYPTLDDQIRIMTPRFRAPLDLPVAVRNLSDYLSSANTAFADDMKLVLQPSWFRSYLESRSAPIRIDGNASDWAPVVCRTTDEKGDGIGRSTGQDLVEAAFTLDTNGNLLFMIRTVSQPIKQQNFYLIIDYDRDWKYEAEVVFFWWTDGNLYIRTIDLAHNNASKDIRAEAAIGSVFEARVPLDQLPYPPPSQPFRVYMGISESGGGNRYDGGSSALDFDPAPVNNALELLLWLAQNKCYAKDDPVTMSLALANDYIYSVADPATTKLILKDITDHYGFYRDIVAGQSSMNVNYPLATAPLIPKIFWAGRASESYWLLSEWMTRHHTNRITPAIYRDLVDSVDTLRDIRKTLLANNLVEASLTRTSSQLEDWVHVNRTYRSSMENLIDFNRRGMFTDEDLTCARDEQRRGLYFLPYDGTNRRWDDFRWLNYQWNLYKTTGRFRGDCGDTTTVQMGVYRAAGICPISLQYIGKTGAAADMHNFPGHYNPRLGRWFTYQKPRFYGYDGRERFDIEIYLYFSKPVYHDWIYVNDWRQEQDGSATAYYYSYYQGERTTSGRLINFLTLGMEESQFERIFLTNLTQRPGQFFNDRTAPATIVDNDFDGLADVLEAVYGTSTASPDTDGDGYSDRWENDWGYDPLKRGEPASPSLPALDGISANELSAPGLISVVSDGQGDSVATPATRNDLRSLSARVFGQNLYLSTSFYNDFRKSTFRDQAFWIIFKDRSRDNVWLQWVGSRPLITIIHNGVWTFVPNTPSGFDMATLTTGEYIIPLSYLGEPDVLYIAPHVSGLVAPTNAYSSEGDTAPFLRLPLIENDITTRLAGILDRGRTVNDPSGDYKAVKQYFDIAKFTVATDGGNIIAAATFHNNIVANPFGAHAVWLRDTAAGKNWWVQWWDTPWLGVWSWKDGEESSKLETDFSDYDCIPWQGGYAFVIPKSLVGNAGSVEIRLCTSGVDSAGKTDYRADETEPVTLNLR